MAEMIERELGWDDVISKESEFVLLPEGDYDFVVESVERGRYNGGEKLPPCNMAIVNLRVKCHDGSTTHVQNRLFLHSKCEGLLSEFFIAIGLKREGEPLKMNWGAVPGAKGRCKIGIRNWIDKDGNTRQSNEVKRFLKPSAPVTPASPTASAAPAAKPFIPGSF